MPKKLQQNKKFSEQSLTKPEQLSLFDLFTAEKDDYSHIVQFYGIIPSKEYKKVERVQGQFLPSLERSFVYRKRKFLLKVTPARITDSDGKDRDAYMSKREELIEDALLKMAADGRRAQSVYLDNQFTVLFTRNALQKELAEQGHAYSYAQIEEAIEILFKSSVELHEEGTDNYDNFHPVASYGFRGRDGEECTYVKFSPQVTAAIENSAFRLVNYKKLMSYSSTIARLLHKRMAHNFTYADGERMYHFSVNNLHRDFGLKEEALLKHKVSEVKSALNELIESKVVAEYSLKPQFDAVRKNKIEDQIVTLTAHEDFIKDVIKANQGAKRRKGEVMIAKFLPDIK